jgi:predicted metal-dependent peptidase
MSISVEKKLTKARTSLLMSAPFFGTLALKLEMIPDPATPTAWTDGISLGYNPGYIQALPMDAIKGLLAHEVMHLALCHHTRQGIRDDRVWNHACDYAINLLLKDAGFTLPGNVLLYDGYTGMGAEAIYDALLKTGNDKENITPGPGEVRPMPGKPSPAEKKLEEQQWKIAVFQANQQAKALGRSHGPGFDRALKQQVLACVNWRVLLQDFVNTAARTDYSWMHPNPRYITRGVYLPGLYAKTLGDIIVAIDTSGSVSESQLAGFAAEVSAILETYDTRLEVIYADRKVRGRETFTRTDLPLALKPQGGGGTDFRPVFDLVEKQGMSPCCLVYLTDLCCDRFPDRSPAYPVLWVNTERFRWKDPPFGRVIDMDEDGPGR